MAHINLRDFYPHYIDCIIEISDEVAAVLYETERLERNYKRRVYRNRAHYSLDAEDGIENDALFLSSSPLELCERRLAVEQLYAALCALPDKQERRVYAHFILGLTKSEIAQIEGVDESAVRRSIERGLGGLRKIFLRNLKNTSEITSQMSWLVKG